MCFKPHLNPIHCHIIIMRTLRIICRGGEKSQSGLIPPDQKALFSLPTKQVTQIQKETKSRKSVIHEKSHLKDIKIGSVTVASI